MDFVNLSIKDKIKRELEVHGLVRLVDCIDYLEKREPNLYRDVIEIYRETIREVLRENPNLH